MQLSRKEPIVKLLYVTPEKVGGAFLKYHNFCEISCDWFDVG